MKLVNEVLPREDRRLTLAKYLAQKAAPGIIENVISELGVGVAASQVAVDFRPNLARDIYRRFVSDAPSARVLDPCHGWGGRLLGFMSSGARGEYVGFDPAVETNAGVREMYDFFLPATRDVSARLECLPFQEAQLGPESFDFAFTSPPYFNTERYSDAARDSATEFDEFGSWVSGFYRPLIEKTLAALRPGAFFLLNVGDKLYPLSSTARAIAAELGATSQFDDRWRIGGSGIGERSSTEESDGEPFLLIQKPPVR